MTLDHYTITTGDLRRSPRSEVGDDAIAVCCELLASGSHKVPGFGAHLRVVRTTGALRRVLRETGAPAADITAPACLARLGPGAMAVAEWAGDLERCLAWAWLEAK